MKKIAIDLRCIAEPRAGKGNYAFHLVRNLIAQDQQNHYLLFLDQTDPEFSPSKNLQIHLLETKSFMRHFEIAKICQQNAIDIFFSPSSYITPSLIKKPTKIVFTVHDLVSFVADEGHNLKAKLIEKLFLRRAIAKATKILTVSKNTQTDLTKLFPQSKDKAEIIYCAADTSFEANSKAKPAEYFLAVGTIQPRKNYINLLKAFEIFRRKNPNYKLMIIGQNGWRSEHFFQLLQESPSRKSIEILGHIDQKKLQQLYQNATALVFPSFYEGFGIPLLEAMNCACPVLCSQTSSIPEVVGDAAVFFNPHQPKEITAAMQKITNNPLLRSQLIEAGLTQSEKFSWGKSAASLLALFEKI
ncbi:glycosyltransferase family 4 protein [Candidatus Gracilibacteria bacterium]|nr:glycosyltransferase family 4 protein [Candidatus Gracilibacteria bacterium]